MKSILINDIYPLELVDDNSLYASICLVILLFFFTFIFGKLLIKNHKYNKNKELRDCIYILKKSTSSRTKAYQISYYGKIIAQTDKEKELFKTLDESLDIYKYQEEPPPLSSEIKTLLKTLINQVESRYV